MHRHPLLKQPVQILYPVFPDAVTLHDVQINIHKYDEIMHDRVLHPRFSALGQYRFYPGDDIQNLLVLLNCNVIRCAEAVQKAVIVCIRIPEKLN